MKLTLLAAAALLASTQAFAVPAFIDFENVTGFAQVDPVGSVSFGSSLQGLVNDGSGNGANGAFFTNAPSPIGVMFVTDPGDAVMNVADGFYGLSFWYSSNAEVDIEIWSGLNGTGNLLGTLSLAANATRGCSDSDFCNFDKIGAQFAAAAYSVNFANATGAAAFDDLAIPEPTTGLLAALALGGLLASRRRA